MLISRATRVHAALSVETVLSAIALAAASAALVSTVVIYAVVLVRIATNAYGATGDFLSFYAAGWLVRTGRAAGLYDPHTIEWAQRLLYPGDFERAIGYPLPVFVAWLFAPFSALPFTAAFFLWMALNAALLGILLRALWAQLTGVPRSLRCVFAGGAALSMPALAVIAFGQVDLIALAGLLAGHRLMRSGRSTAAGAALALAAVKPHLLAGVVALLLARREWKAVSVLSSMAFTLIVVPALLTAPGSLLANLRMLSAYPSSGAELAVNAEVMSNWRGFVVSLTGRNDVATWLPGMAALALGALALAAPRWIRARTSHEFDQAYSLAVLFPLVASPHLHTQSLVLLLLPAALAIRRAWESSPSPSGQRAIVNAILIAFAALFFLPFLAIQGLSLTVFLLIALYAWVALRWPRGVVSSGAETGQDAPPRASDDAPSSEAARSRGGHPLGARPGDVAGRWRKNSERNGPAGCVCPQPSPPRADT